jgi:NAD(P)-dependent dehydrogenase (short-subunit alcohol dehydrogenase family)
VEATIGSARWRRVMEVLKEKVAVVTGAARGFGFALAAALADEEMRVVLADIDESGLEAAVRRLTAAGAEAIGVPTDVADADAVVRLRDAAFERFETVHVLCNNAASGGGGSLCEPIDVAAWERVFAVDLVSVLHGLNAFLPRMLAQQEGHIVNVASRQGLVPSTNLGAYPPAKAALITLTEMLQAELAEREAAVGATVLTPGGIKTEALLSGLEAYGDRDEGDPMRDFFTSRVAAAVEPAVFARLAVRAIREGALYVNSHRETLDWLRQRVDRMEADANRMGTVR